MPTLAEKIEQDAKTRLVLPPNRLPREEIPRYKAFLKLEHERLRMVHRAGAGGREVCRARAALLDVLLRYILEPVMKPLTEPKDELGPFALVAIGGYGRAELNPFSDIDIMFLHTGDLNGTGKKKGPIGTLTDALLYTLWDLGLKVGHSVRTVEDCVHIANSDMQSKTSLIEARRVVGDAALFDRMQASVLARCVREQDDDYIALRLLDQAARRAKFGNSPLMQEPNIKNGCGGLRDYQNLLWMAFFKYRVRSLAELQQRGLISEAERKQLDTAYDFLLRTRNELHYTAKRAVDVLTKSVQPAVATGLGYAERSPSVRVEQFMRVVYTHLRNVYLITRTIEERLALLPKATRFPRLRALIRRGTTRSTRQTVDGFVIENGQISETTRSFKEQPRRLMRLFLHMQQRGVKLHPDLAQAIRNELRLADRAFASDPHVHHTFLEILNQRGNVAPILRAMHEIGLLGKFIPEFGRLTCLVQHEFYHQYTTDEHTLVCLEKLDRIGSGSDPALARYTELFHQVERPFVLYLALLLHDAGKADSGGDHSEAGARLSLSIAQRWKLDGSTAHSLRLLIKHHLLMAQLSQRRDMDDPAVIESFAEQVQSRENLRMLTLHSVADAMGTSDQLWNSFKDSLLWTLYARTEAFLSGARDSTEQKQTELLRDSVRAMLPPTFSPDEIDAHFTHLPPRYFHIHSAKEIASDLTLAHRFMHLQLSEEDKALEPVVTWHNEPDRGYTSVHICTWDRAGLFAKIAGSLSAAGFNILSAQIFTRTDGVILDTFYITDAKGASLAKKEGKELFEKILVDVLTGKVVDLPSLIRKQARQAAAYQAHEGERLPTTIHLDNQASQTSTVIEISTEDRVGLLYLISQKMANLGLDIQLAKILTERGAAIDTFYVRTWDGQRIGEGEHEQYVQAQLLEALATLR